MTVTDKNVAPIYCCAQFVTQGSGSETFTKDIYDVRALNKSTKNVKEKITKSATVEEINAGLMGNKIFSPLALAFSKYESANNTQKREFDIDYRYEAQKRRFS